MKIRTSDFVILTVVGSLNVWQINEISNRRFEESAGSCTRQDVDKYTRI